MAVDPTNQARWNRAVVSVYYLGRKSLYPDVFARGTLPGGSLSLKEAVDALTADYDPRSMRFVRLALTEMARHYNLFSPSEDVEHQFRRLSLHFAELAGVQSSMRGQLFTDIVAHYSGQDAYLRVLQAMALLHASKARIRGFIDYNVERKSS